MYAPTAAAIDMKNPPAGHVWATNISAPYVVTGLTNGTTYSFTMNGRTGGGPGGPQTPTVSTVPRAAGTTGLWTTGTPLANDLRGVATDGTNYFSVGAQGAVYKSTDGQSWNNVSTTTTGANTLSAISYVNTTVGYVVSDTSRHVYNGTDPSNLAQASQILSSNVNAFATDGTNIVAVGDNGTILLGTSGSTWTSATSVPGSASLYGVVYSSGKWVAVGTNGAIYVSTDSGANWAVPSGTYSTVTQRLNGVAAYGTSFVAVGDGGTVVTSADGATWSSQTLPGSANLYAVNASQSQSQYLIVGAAGAAFLSTDLVTWTPEVTNLTNDIRAITGSATKYVVVGLSGANAISD
jgi:photosystem II stability/assembly factor-like uncharacterized protein